MVFRGLSGVLGCRIHLVPTILVTMLMVPNVGLAMDSTEVLPESINSPSVRVGYISGIGMKFLSNGNLMTLGDINSLEFDVKTLRQFEPRVAEFVSVLNQFGNQRLGDELSLGVLRVDTTPEVKYWAPVYARGLTRSWTLGVGLPIVTYKNRLRLFQTGSNLAAIRSLVGSASEELNQAFRDLDIDLATTAKDTIVSKGYKPLIDRDETMLGDLQIVSLVQMNKTERFSSQIKTVVTLPTGPDDDPDDLADLGAFGYTAVENQLLGNYIPFRSWRLAARVGYRYNLPDDVIRRVPLNELDTLPGLESKMKVHRKAGDSFVGGLSVTHSPVSGLDLAVGWEMNQKMADAYSGDLSLRNGVRYDLISNQESAASQTVRLGASYSTIESFFDGKSLLPSIISYEFSDTFIGRNTERMTIHELWLQLFF